MQEMSARVHRRPFKRELGPRKHEMIYGRAGDVEGRNVKTEKKKEKCAEKNDGRRALTLATVKASQQNCNVSILEM